MKIEFTKMHGLGNDYIYVNTMKYPLTNPEEKSIAWSRPHTGIGSDGLVLIGDSDKADFSMRIFNADGSEAKMCGNASRCIGKYLYEYGLTTKTDILLDTLSGIKELHLQVKEGKVESVRVDMGIPADIHWVDLGDAYPFQKGVAVSMGNPHAICFIDNINNIDIAKIGPIIENDKCFPNKTNVEFIEIISKNEINMRVWERGTGETLACGTGACASVIASILNGYTDRKVTVNLLGGKLEILWNKEDNHVYMKGPARTVYEGEID